MTEHDAVEIIKSNIAFTRELIAAGETPEVIGTVSGSESAREFWQSILDRAGETLKAREAVSFHEDLPVNQAFGILLLWQRLKPYVREDRGSLVAFVFGEGTRATPFTETDNAQKPAIATYVSTTGADGSRRLLSMVELAMYYRVPVQQYLRRSGFDGLVVQWGDEVQIPTCDLRKTDSRLANADIVRFVSVCEMTADQAAEKDWVGIDADGRVTAFIPRRPLAEMEQLADRGLLQRRDGKLFGGINLGSIAVSYRLLDALLAEFSTDVNDTDANRQQRPDLDPQFFTALTIAVVDDPAARTAAWAAACEENRAMAALHEMMPDILSRLRRVIETVAHDTGRRLNMRAMDCGEPFWGDIGQHRQIYKFYTALRATSAAGEISRAIAQIADVQPDSDGNRIVDSELGPDVEVHGSVLIGVTVSGRGTITDSVLIGTRAQDIVAEQAFDVGSTVGKLRLAARSGTYKVVTSEPVDAGPGERCTTLFMPGHGGQLVHVHEDTDLRDRENCYDQPILDNPLSFREAHEAMGRIGVEQLAELRQAAADEVLAGR